MWALRDRVRRTPVTALRNRAIQSTPSGRGTQLLRKSTIRSRGADSIFDGVIDERCTREQSTQKGGRVKVKVRVRQRQRKKNDYCAII